MFNIQFIKMYSFIFIQVLSLEILAFPDTNHKLPKKIVSVVRPEIDVKNTGDFSKLPRNIMATILHRNNFFQDIFSENVAPMKIQFGHVCENPREWEQRFEQKDFQNNQHQGKIKWNDKNGVYGEQYWDLNH